MSKISVSNLTKSFNNKVILNDINFSVEEGSVVTFLGNSGAGKTTIFRILSGLENPDAGNIQCFGKKIGFIFQQFHLWKHMTVLENCILAPVHALKISKAKASQKAEIYLSQLGLSHKLQDYPTTLSGGEQQRVAIVRALMMEPDILLFDEPTSSLDPERTEIIVNIIQSLMKKGLIVLVITHDINFAVKISHQVLFLDNGNLIESAKCNNGKIESKNARFSKFLNNTLIEEHPI